MAAITIQQTKRIQILSSSEINELYSLPNFSRADREDYFSLDKETQKLVNTLRQTETRIYFILLLGYFRSRPIVFNFTFTDVEADYNYIKAKYFSDKNVLAGDVPPRTKTSLVSKLLSYTGFSVYQNKNDKEALIKRLNDVVKINLEPRYVFDECIAYFGQNRIALAGYTTLQDTISTVLSNERSRIESVLNQHLSSDTKATLLKLLDSNSTFTDLARLKRMAKDFSTSQITQELKTHKIIRSLYPEIKALIAELELSPKNLEYYASLVKHKSVYKLKRHADSQTVLYLVCYLFFRYRETNDNLVSAFIYLVRKLTEGAKNHAKQRVVDDVNIVRTKLKSAGSLLKYFIDSDIDDELTFGDVRKKAFKLLPAENIKLLSEHLDNNDFDGRKYEWQFIDKQSSKVSKLLLWTGRFMRGSASASLIKREWENIQRIICSLSRKTTTQSTIITKLSNGKQNSRTLAALREYDRIIKCLYVLDYVDDKVLRQFVQQALNRGEAYHQLRRAIASINGNQFRRGNDYQIDQWNDCARIIANCTIYSVHTE